MNILDAIMSAQGGAAARQLGSQFGLGEEQTAAALGALVPALAAGFQRNVQSQGGLDDLLGALTGGQHQQYVDNPFSLGQASAAADGNGILGHIFGNKDVSRQVATRAATQTGLSPELLKQMLPLVAALMMGAFAKRSAGASAGGGFGAGAPGATPGGGITDMLGSMLDANRDGSMVDDVVGMLGKFLR